MVESSQIIGLFMLGASVLFTPLAVLFGKAPVANAPVLVIFPPWKDGEKLVQQAGGSVMGPGAAPAGLLALGPGEGFLQRLGTTGAIWVLNGTRLAVLCGEFE